LDAPLVLGTAGHIDHGKTALIRALTGVDTDRLPEEKTRGITIVLGFAPLDLTPELRLSVVDVPGHEGLVRTMIAGATGIDLVLLVVAADEGVMPQTREHLAICELLGIRRGVVALTKIDAADPDVAELAAEEVADFLAGSGLADAPIQPVSALTGEGLDALREALVAAAGEAGARTPRSGPPRLGIDRSFAAKGFGAVVTGTLVGSPVSVGDELEILPGRKRVRVRGLQSFGADTVRASPGARTAINLQGVDQDEVAPGLLLAAPDAIVPTGVLDAEVRWLAEAPTVEGAAAVEFLAGTATRRARIAPIGNPRIEPGSSCFARIHLDDGPVALLPGDRFVLRGFARTALGGATLGGGRALDVAPPHRRLGDPALQRELEVLASDDPAAGVEARVARTGFAGIEARALLAETGLRAEEQSALLESARDAGRLCCTPSGTWLGSDIVCRLEERILERLVAFHTEEPLRPGIQRGTLRGALPANTAGGVFELLLERVTEAGRVESHDEYVRLADHVPVLSQHQEAITAHLRADAMTTALEPKIFQELCDEVKAPAAELRELLAYLERDGSLVRAPGDLWFDRVAVDELRDRVVAHLREHGSLDTSAYKALIGTTRKYAVPLMELFDNEHLTIRRGETRVLRRG